MWIPPEGNLVCNWNEVIVLPPIVQRIGLKGKKCSFVCEAAVLRGSVGFRGCWSKWLYQRLLLGQVAHKLRRNLQRFWLQHSGGSSSTQAFRRAALSPGWGIISAAQMDWRFRGFFSLAQGVSTAPLTSTVSSQAQSLCPDMASFLYSHSVEEKFGLTSDTSAQRENGAKISGIWHTCSVFKRDLGISISWSVLLSKKTSFW